MNIRRAAVIFGAGIITAACSEKSATAVETDATTPQPPRELVQQPGVKTADAGRDLKPPAERQIARDCLAVLRATKVVPGPGASADCPGCPAGGTEVLAFRQMSTDAVSCSADTCTVVVTIRAVFNPGSGQTIAGGLTAWIPPEQRSAYLSGQVPAGEQAYRLQITYRRRGEAWQPVEFERAPDG